jgi:hypothetical protein
MKNNNPHQLPFTQFDVSFDETSDVQVSSLIINIFEKIQIAPKKRKEPRRIYNKLRTADFILSGFPILVINCIAE